MEVGAEGVGKRKRSSRTAAGAKPLQEGAEHGWGGGGRKGWAPPGYCCPQGDQATMASLSREDNELISARVRPAVYN